MIQSSPRHPDKKPHHFRRTAAWAGMLLAPLAAQAAGLAPAIGSPVMGEPLAIEIPLIEPENLSLECFELTQHPGGSDSQFFPRKAKLQLKKKSDGSHALLVQGPEFIQPVLEFRVAITCGTQIARDYVMLVSPGRELRYEPVALTRPTATPSAAISPPPAAIEPSPRPARPGPSIEQMAGSRYPHQPKARAKFKQQLRATNPALQGFADDAPIPLDADVKLPPDPPKVRADPYVPPKKKGPAPLPAPMPQEVLQAAPPAAPALPPPTAVAPLAKPSSAPAAEEKAKDRLTISTGIGLSGATAPTGAAEGELQAKAEASFSQQEEMAAKLAQTEAAYNELKQQIQRMESRLASLELERQRLAEETRKQTDWSMLLGAASILGGGLLGALLMMFVQRARSRRSAYDVSVFDIGDIGKK